MKYISQLAKSELVQVRFLDLIKLRLPWLIVGLLGGFFTSIIISQFEMSLRENIALVFFIPIVAYVSDEIGTQTETIFIRALSNLKFNIAKYMFREFLVGVVIGLIVGLIGGVFAGALSGVGEIGLVVGVSLFLAMSLAVVLACLTPLVLKSLGKDPAVGSGPFTTAVQDLVSVTIYLMVAAAIL